MSEELKAKIDKYSHEMLVDAYYRSLLDWVDDDTIIRESAAKVIDQKWLDGDRYFVPFAPDIVDKLVEMVIERDNKIKELTNGSDNTKET